MNQNEDQIEVKKLYDTLVKEPCRPFPAVGAILDAPEERGVYIIYGPKDDVQHVGSTPTGQRGIAGRLRNHMAAASSFVRIFLKGNGSLLRVGYSYQYIVVENPRHRILLEAYAIGSLCPAHIGHGAEKTTP